MDCKNLFHLPSTPLDEEWIDTLVDNPTLRIERIISTGQTSSWYCQQEHEFVSLLQGEAELEWEDGQNPPCCRRYPYHSRPHIPSGKLYQ